VTESGGVVEFTGTATGNITVSFAGAVATFSRGGVTATTTADFGGTATKVTLASGQTLADTAADLASIGVVDGAGSLTVTDASTLAEIDAIDFSGVAGTVTYSLADTAAALAVAGAVGDAATNMETTDAASVAEATDIAALTNTGTTTYTLEDTLANLVSAGGTIVDDATSYVLSDVTTSFEDMLIADALSADEVAMIQGASNAADYTYSLDDSLDNLMGAASGVVAAADSYSLSDVTTSFEDMSLADELKRETT
jgi:hypothetical protein